VTSEPAVAAPRDVVRVLIVEDHKVVRAGLAAELAAPGFLLVGEAASGREAIAEAMRLQPDVVLLDLGPPGMDGIEVARRLRAYPQLAGVRIVALTGFGQGSDRKRSAAVGIESHLLKPVDVATVMEAIGAGRVTIVPESSA
jgi:CheY-like chemotaxis protein